MKKLTALLLTVSMVVSLTIRHHSCFAGRRSRHPGHRSSITGH